MDRLIEQTKTQIWKIINALSDANKDKKDIVLQVGLFEYGKDSLPKYLGYQAEGKDINPLLPWNIQLQ